MQKSIQRYVLSNWDKIFPGEQAPQTLSTLQISQSHEKEHRYGRVVHLLFEDNSDTPVMAAKFCKDSRYEGSLERESVFIRELESSAIKDNVPKVLDTHIINGKLVVFEEAAPGTPFSVLAKNAYYSLNGDAFKEIVKGHMNMASTFLTSLREATRNDSSNPWTEIDDVVSDYSRRLELSGNEKYLVYGLARAVEEIIGDNSPTTLVHTDFITSNVFLSLDGKIKAIDWEFASKRHLGFLDTMRFIYHYYIILKDLGALGDDSFHETFIKRSNWFSSLSLEFAENVEGKILGDAANFRTLFAFFLIFDLCLQSEVNMIWNVLYKEYHRELINNFIGFSSLKEMEDLRKDKRDLLERQEDLLEELGQLQIKMAGMNKMIESMSNSKSWRLTYPIRWVSARMKGVDV